MQNREREWPVLLPVNCNGTLANIAEKGRKMLDESDWKMSFEEIPPTKSRDLGEILRTELYVDGIYLDGAGI